MSSFSTPSSSSSSTHPSPSRSSSKSSFFKMQPQARSISLPSRLHPSSLAVEEHLHKLKSWQSSSSSTTPLGPLSLKTIQSGLLGLADLYISTENLIQTQLTRQALAAHNNGRLIEEALDASITFINILGVVRDLVGEMNDRTRDLQSALRRRRGKNNIDDGSAAAYVGLRKKSRKEIVKGMRELKQMESKYGLVCPVLFEIDPYLAMVVRVLREVNEMSIDVFRVLLDCLSVPVIKSKGGWSNLISRLAVVAANSNKSGGGIQMMNEVGSVDYALCSSSSSSVRSGEEVEKKLRVLEGGMEQVEKALDALFRCLVRNRVSFLNMVTQ